MKIPFRISALAGLCLFLLTMMGCTAQDAPDMARNSDPSTAAHVYADHYLQAANRLLAATDLTVHIETKTDITVGSEIFAKHSQQTLSYTDIGSDAMLASMEETLTVGTHTVAIREQYAAGNGYFTVNGSPFTAPMTAESFLARFAPIKMLDESLYRKVTADIAENQTVLRFSEPTAAENWALPANSQFTGASGQTFLSASGDLLRSIYQLSYTYDGAVFAQTTVVTYDTTPLSAITVPASTDSYLALENPDIPRLLEEACGYLTQAQAVTASATEVLHSEAFGIDRTQTTTLHMFGSGDRQLALRNTGVEVINHSHGDEASRSVQTERFIDGQYTIETNGFAPANQGSITSAQMRKYCQELLVSSLLLPEYIEYATISDSENICRLSFTGSERLAKLVGNNACKTLYQDPQLLNNLAADYQTDTISAYLEIDRYTGLPVASGIHYSGTHTIEQTPYVLSSKFDQIYTLASTEAYDAITNAE